jgi:hypothetical protein
VCQVTDLDDHSRYKAECASSLCLLDHDIQHPKCRVLIALSVGTVEDADLYDKVFSTFTEVWAIVLREFDVRILSGQCFTPSLIQ